MKPFSSYISPMSTAEFISEHRGKRPLYFPGTPDRFASLLDIDSLNQALSTTILAMGTVRVRRPDGGQFPLDDISTPIDLNKDRRAIRVQFLEDQLKTGSTLTVEYCESFFQNVQAMCSTIAETMLARVYATLFLVYQPERPCGLHWDDRDMFICQVAGRKTWPVYKPHYANPFLDQRRVTYRSPISELYQEFTLEPGDALYMPRGWLHNPAASEGSSMHVAFAIATPTGVDLLDWIRSDLKDASAELRADLPIPLSAAEKHAHAAKLREIIMERLSDEAIENYYQRHKSNVYSRPVKLPELASQPLVHAESQNDELLPAVSG